MVWFGLITFAIAVLLLLAALVFTIIALARRNTLLTGHVHRLMQAAFAVHSLSLLALWVLLISGNNSVAYVNTVTNPDMPLLLKFTALWGGQAGSLFIWGWVLHACTFIAQLRPKEETPLWAVLVENLVILFFVALSLLVENPFARIWQLSDGSLFVALFTPQAGAQPYTLLRGVGLNPLLRHPGMVIHPPILYLGYAAFLVPFGEAIAFLVAPLSKPAASQRSQTWLVSAWIFLSAGIALGSWWSYDVLGWGGYWGWDPVEVGSLLPWLSATALLHTSQADRRYASSKRFHLSLVLLSFLLVLFSVFITRAGVLASVHAFGESQIAIPMAIFMGLMLISSIILLARRWKGLRSGHEISAFFNREALILYTNLVLLALVVICLWGILFPLLSSSLQGQQLVMDAAYFSRGTAPLFILLVFLLAICPQIGWQVNSFKKLGLKFIFPILAAVGLTVLVYLSGIQQWTALLGFGLAFLGIITLLILTLHELATEGVKGLRAYIKKHQRRYGAYLVHLGILLIALGITGMETMQVETQKTIAYGERITLGAYEVELVNIDREIISPEYESIRAETILYKDGQALATLYPGQDHYPDLNQLVAIPAVRHGLLRDVYVILLDQQAMQGFGSLRLSVNPLVNWLWIGSAALVLGGLLVLFTYTKKAQDK